MKNRDKATAQLAAYGYQLTPSDCLKREGRDATTVEVREVKGRFQTRLNGRLLWSGPDLGSFLESFWFAEKVGKA